MRKELAHRESTGIAVTLWWYADTNGVAVVVADEHEEFELTVDPSRALDAFHHPFAYAA